MSVHLKGRYSQIHGLLLYGSFKKGNEIAMTRSLQFIHHIKCNDLGVIHNPYFCGIDYPKKND